MGDKFEQFSKDLSWFLVKCCHFTKFSVSVLRTMSDPNSRDAGTSDLPLGIFNSDSGYIPNFEIFWFGPNERFTFSIPRHEDHKNRVPKSTLVFTLKWKLTTTVSIAWLKPDEAASVSDHFISFVVPWAYSIPVYLITVTSIRICAAAETLTHHFFNSVIVGAFTTAILDHNPAWKAS